jgi:hypothetical protein
MARCTAVGWDSRIPQSPSSEAAVKTLRLAAPLALAAFTLTCQSDQTTAPDAARRIGPDLGSREALGK